MLLLSLLSLTLNHSVPSFKPAVTLILYFSLVPSYLLCPPPFPPRSFFPSLPSVSYPNFLPFHILTPFSCLCFIFLLLSSSLLPGETLKEQQVPRHLPKPSSSFSSSSTSRLRDFKETMSNIIHSRPLSSSSSSSLPAAVLSEITSSTINHHLPASTAASCSSSSKLHDWEADSTSSESKSSCSGGAGSGRCRPAWRPRREVLNIDSIFSRERRRQAGYSPLGASLQDDCRAPASEGADASFPAQEEVKSVRPGSSWTLPTTSNSHRAGGDGPGGGRGSTGGVRGGADLPPPPPPPPRLIQRMESGYESSDRNSSSPVSLDLNLGDR